MLDFFAYADRASLTVLFSLMTLFLGIFLTGFRILHIFMSDLKQSILEKKSADDFFVFVVFFNWDLLQAKLNSHYKAWICIKKAHTHTKIKAYRKSV